MGAAAAAPAASPRKLSGGEEAGFAAAPAAPLIAFNLVETIDGRENYVIDGEPRPGYEPKLKQAKILPKFRYRAWIDKDETQWKKVDIECIDTVSWGWFIARIHKGSRIVIEQTRVNDEVWLPQHTSMKVDARVALLKEFNIDLDMSYRDYKKFRTETKIIPGGEVVEQQ